MHSRQLRLDSARPDSEPAKFMVTVSILQNSWSRYPYCRIHGHRDSIQIDCIVTQASEAGLISTAAAAAAIKLEGFTLQRPASRHSTVTAPVTA